MGLRQEPAVPAVNRSLNPAASDPGFGRKNGAPVKRTPCYLALAVVTALVALAGPAASPQDTVRYSFVYLGCNRLQDSDWKPMKETNPSSANVPQLQQTLADIGGLNPSPQLFFFVGDLVLNLEPDDGKTLQKQLDAWTLLYNASPPAGKIPLMPLPGNHEMLQQLSQQTPKVKAYLCAHAHEWSAIQLGGAGGVWQVVAGNGGSPLEHSWNPPGGPFYGFTLVKLYTSGQVSVTSFQRPVPDPYFAADPLPSPAQPQPEIFPPR